MKRCIFLPLLTAALAVAPHARAQMSISSSAASVSQTLQATDYNLQTGTATLQKTAAHTFSIQSSSNWLLSVKTLTSAFSFGGFGDSNPDKPAGDLSIRVTGVGSWLNLSTNTQAVTSGAAQLGGDPPAEVSVDYRFSSNLKNDPPGSYSITVIWTLSAP